MTTTSYNIYQQITSVRLASTGNISGSYFNGALNNGVGATLTALTDGQLSLDGVLVQVGDRLLLKDQTDATQNGLYDVVTPGSSSGLWMIQRTADFQSLEQLKVGQYFSVGAGNTLAGSMYVLIEPLPSTIGMGTFHFVNVADGAIPVGPYLLKANNLSDVNNSTTSIENIGLGRPGILILTDADFAADGGTYLLTNPPPIYVSMSTTTPGRVLQLPPQNEANSLQASQNITLLTGNPSQAININNGAGTLIFQVGQDSAWQAVPNDRTTVAGAWVFLGIVQTLNALSGNAELTSTDGSVTITPNPVNQHIDLSVIGSGTDLSQLIYVNSLDGNDSNDGSIGRPLKTYNASRLLAISRGASVSKSFTLMCVGDFSITGDMTLSPFVNISGTYMFDTKFTISGNIILDASWNSTSVGFCYINNCYFKSTALNLTFTTWQGSGIIPPTVVFDACCVTEVNTVNLIGSGTSTSGVFEQVYFMNCAYSPFVVAGSPIYNSTNIALLLNNSDNSGGVNSIANTANAGASTVIIGTFFQAGNCSFSCSTAGGLIVQFEDVQFINATVNVDGTNVQLFTDTDSWSFSPTFTSGASVSAFRNFNLSDGMPATSYSPTHFTPVGGTIYPATSQTAYNRGIDNALGTKPTEKDSGSATLVGGTVTVSSPTVASGDSIVLTCVTAGGTQGIITVSYNAGVSFTLTSSNPLDTSTYKWMNLGA